ncbi:hypothetical protein AAW51_2559 [Caldimonas brevitalea]|uniref:Uncharacterized protein n=1 Tax=Caldimonas brevitalea TaxID=413882 RepID=A0A0G3BRT9_9BURK|nr:hypothetical protein AAW51_2559 [Caldimonas brevitalea]
MKAARHLAPPADAAVCLRRLPAGAGCPTRYFQFGAACRKRCAGAAVSPRHLVREAVFPNLPGDGAAFQKLFADAAAYPRYLAREAVFRNLPGAEVACRKLCAGAVVCRLRHRRAGPPPGRRWREGRSRAAAVAAVASTEAV